jgi:hypothetical protein
LLVTIPEAARRSGLGLRQFRRAVLNGELPVFDIGDWPRVRWNDVVAWIESNRRLYGDLPTGGRGTRGERAK